MQTKQTHRYRNALLNAEYSRRAELTAARSSGGAAWLPPNDCKLGMGAQSANDAKDAKRNQDNRGCVAAVVRDSARILLSAMALRMSHTNSAGSKKKQPKRSSKHEAMDAMIQLLNDGGCLTSHPRT